MTVRKSSITSAYLASFVLAGGFALAATAVAQTSAPAPTMPLPGAKPLSPPSGTPTRPASASPGDGQAATSDQLFALWDIDKNKMLSLTEFKNGWESAREQNIIGRLEAQFRAADKDKSGLIESGEFSNLALIKRAGSSAPPMSAFDSNKDQKLDFKEYLDMVPVMMKRLAPASR